MSDLIRRSRDDIKPSTPEDLERLHQAAKRPIDLSDIPERTGEVQRALFDPRAIRDDFKGNSPSPNRLISNSDPRSVVDYMKYWTDEAILAELDTRRHNFSIILENELRDLNLGNIVRSANAFMADRIILLFRRRYDRRAAISSYRYMHFHFAEDIITLQTVLNDLEQENSMPIHFVAIDNNLDAKPLPSYVWPKDKHVVMAFGHEGRGIHPDLSTMADDIIYIPQYGSVRSLNVAVAAGIVMNDFCEKTT